MAWGRLPNSGLRGFDKVLANLQKELLNIEGGTLQGLLLACAKVRRETETNSPITPIDKGNLRSSWFTVSAGKVGGVGHLARKGVAVNVKNKFGTTLKTGNFVGPKSAQLSANHISTIEEARALVESALPEILVMMGYSANYAMIVHEMLDREFHRPQSGPKWFEAAIKRTAWDILKIVRDNAKIKK